MPSILRTCWLLLLPFASTLVAASLDPPRPRAAAALEESTSRLVKAGEAARAIRIAGRAAARHPRQGWYAFHHGELLRRHSTRFDEAVEAFEAALEAGYESGLVYRGLGAAAHEAGRHARAVQALEAAEAFDRAARDRARAGGDARRADGHARRLAQHCVRLVEPLEELGRFQDAFAAIERGLASGGSNPWLPGLRKDRLRGMGDVALAAGDYPRALDFYRRARAAGDEWGWYPDFLELVARRARMGEVRPEAVHRFLVVHVRRGHRTRPDGSVEVVPGIGARYQAKLRLGLQVTRALVEAMSQGRWSLAWDEVDAEARYREGPLQRSAHPDHLDVGAELFAREGDFDTLLIHSNLPSPHFSRGHFGGAGSYPFVPGVSYGRRRGMLTLGGGAGVGIVLHELFHALENLVGGMPAHAFRDRVRAKVPEWTGEGELNYYAWRFDRDLARKGWENLGFRRPGERVRDAAAFQRLRRAYRAIPLERRQDANAMAREAAALADAGERDRARALYRRALQLSPYQARALEALAGVGPEGETYRERLGTLRAVSAFYPDHDHYAYLREVRGGVEVGRWSPETVALEPRTLRWDVSAHVDGPGTYRATFLYDGGQAAVTIERAALTRAGAAVARDVHEGWSGNRKRRISYDLVVPPSPPGGGPWELEARLRSMRSTDSRGQVLWRKLARR